MLTIKLQNDGITFSDFDLIEKAKVIVGKYKDGTCLCLCVSTGNIIEALRVLVARGELPYNELKIIFNDEVITLNKIAEYSRSPKGFMDWDMEFLKEVIGRRAGVMGFEKTIN